MTFAYQTECITTEKILGEKLVALNLHRKEKLKLHTSDWVNPGVSPPRGLLTEVTRSWPRASST